MKEVTADRAIPTGAKQILGIGSRYNQQPSCLHNSGENGQNAVKAFIGQMLYYFGSKDAVKGLTVKI